MYLHFGSGGVENKNPYETLLLQIFSRFTHVCVFSVALGIRIWPQNRTWLLATELHRNVCGDVTEEN